MINYQICGTAGLMGHMIIIIVQWAYICRGIIRYTFFRQIHSDLPNRWSMVWIMYKCTLLQTNIRSKKNHLQMVFLGKPCFFSTSFCMKNPPGMMTSDVVTFMPCLMCRYSATVYLDIFRGFPNQGSLSHHGCFNTEMVIHDFNDLGYPHDLGNLDINWVTSGNLPGQAPTTLKSIIVDGPQPIKIPYSSGSK